MDDNSTTTTTVQTKEIEIKLAREDNIKLIIVHQPTLSRITFPNYLEN